MKNFFITTLCLIVISVLTGCNAERGTTVKDLQRLSMLEIYSSDGELVSVIEDTNILHQFNDLDYTGTSNDTDFSQTELKNAAEGLSTLYTIISYKSSAAVLNSGTLEKLMETTIYESSNIIKEQVAPGNIKGFSIPEDYLSFYISVSEEDMDFLLSLAEFNG